MRSLTPEEFTSEYLIYKTFTPDKDYKTYLAMKAHSDGSFYPVILKEMDEKRAMVYQVLTEIWNPFLANTYDVFLLAADSCPDQQRYVAVTECVCTDGVSEEEFLSLAQFVRQNGPLPEKTALSVCSQICEGLKEFHKKGFVHRDLKPENIMVSKYSAEDPQIKIIDFGSAKQRKPTGIADTTVTGTLGYQAPESISSLTTNRADIYSIGCILNYMLTGQEPGIANYKGRHYIVSIIEKATNEDSTHRYPSVTAMQKEIDHELRKKTLDKIPIVRSIPGFRTHTLWKEVVALLGYPSMLLFAVVCWNLYGLLDGCAETFFYCIVPLVILFNAGNFLRFFPEKLRKNNRLFLMVRTSIILCSLIGPVLVEYIVGV